MTGVGLRVRAIRSLRVGGVYAAALVPVGLTATLLSIAFVEAAYHVLPGHPGPALLVAANVLPALGTGFAAYVALGRWAARREILAPGLIAHWLRTWAPYVASLWLGVLLLPDLVRGTFHGSAQLLLWPCLSTLGAIVGDIVAALLGPTTTRRRLVVVTLCAVVIGGTIAGSVWVRHVPSSPMFATIGLPGPRADSDRECGHMYTRLVWHSLPTRDITCRGRVSGRRGLPGFTQTHVGLDALTRRLKGAVREWQLPDSVTWERAQDSVRVALRARGGREVACRRPGASRYLTHIRQPDRFWDFPGYMVRLTAYYHVPGAPPGRRPEWLLQLQAFPGLAPECGGPLRRYARPPR